MNPGGNGSSADYPGDVLNALAIGLAADTSESGRKALDVVRVRSPELMRLSEQTGEDLLATSVRLIDVLLLSLRSDIELPWSLFEQRARDEGRLRAAQGVPLEALIDVVSIYRRAALELVTAPLVDSRRRDEIMSLAQRRIEDVVERLTSRIAQGYLDHMDAQLRVKGRSVGVMSVGTQLQRVFGPTDFLFMAAVADQVAIVLDRARQFSSESRTDHLTGLANRREFERVMEREVALAERHDRRLTMMMIDLDNLKRINDRQGHGGGDAALRVVAQQLQRVVRASDLCARIGGDEFAVAMPETDIERGREVATRLRSAIRETGLGVKSVEAVEVSIGLSSWRRGQDWQTVYQSADSDLYEDKRRRKIARRQTTTEGTKFRLLPPRGVVRRRVAGS